MILSSTRQHRASITGKGDYHEVLVARQDVVDHLLQLALANNFRGVQVERLEEVLILLPVPQPAQKEG